MFRATYKISLVYFLIDVIVIFLCFFIPYLLHFNFNAIRDLHFSNLNFPGAREYIYICIAWGVLITAMLQRRKLYSTDRTLTILRESLLVLTSVFYVSIAAAAFLFFIQPESIGPVIFVWSFISLSIAITVWRVIKRVILRYLIVNGFHNFNVLIVGQNTKSLALFEKITANPYLGLRVVGLLDDEARKPNAGLPVLGKTTDFEKVCKKYFIDEVFISDASREGVVSLITAIAQKMHIGLRIIPPSLSNIERFGQVHLGFLNDMAFLTLKEREVFQANLYLKRLLDLIISVPFLIILSPFMIILALWIKLDSSGPIFYIQKRMGKRKEVFRLYKFRSMVFDADERKNGLLGENEVQDGIIFKLRNDPRITRVGKSLRKYSLDELPQLINVIKGDLSLVGPRPFPIEESESMAFYHLPRLNIRPGLTGLAQVRGRSNLSFRKWVRFDLWYIRNWSLGLDLRILLLTIPSIFKGRGAY